MSGAAQTLSAAELARALRIRLLAVEFVEAELGVSARALVARRRERQLVRARALFVWLVRTHAPQPLSFPRIARWLGGRHHTSIMHLFKTRAPELIASDPAFAGLCTRFAERLVECGASNAETPS